MLAIGVSISPAFADDIPLNPLTPNVIPEVVVRGNRCDGWDGAMEVICRGGSVYNNDIKSHGSGSIVKSPSVGVRSPDIGPAVQNEQMPVADAETRTCPATGNPVVLSTGEKIKDELDFASRGEYGMSVARIYRSKQVGGKMFGPNWLSNLDVPKIAFTQTGCTITQTGDCIPQKATIVEPDGTKYTFKFTGGINPAGMSAAVARKARLESSLGVKSSSSRTVMDPGDSYVYNVGGAASTGEVWYTPGNSWIVYRGNLTYFYDGSGYIQSITDDTGVGINYTYTGLRVDKITHTNGKFIQLTWGTNGRVTTLKDPSGNNWVYGYNTAGMLTSVTSPVGSGTADVRNYHYENADTTLLTGISINSVRYSTYSYYSDKRVSQSSLAGGEESESFVYGTDQTTVTDALGQPTVYGFTTILGEKRLTSVSRSATGTCGAASAQTVYLPSGYVDYTLDWKGNRTQYSVDGAGRILSVTTAYGTADALTVTNIWSGDKIDHIDYAGTNGIAYARTSYTAVVK